MKKLFTMLVASVCCSMAFAATSPTTISVSNVTILKGGTAKQMEVTINATGNTAFQFDLTLPKGVSVKKVTLGSIESNKTPSANQTRQLRHKLYDSNANKYRFLSYDNGNAALTDTKVIITLEAAATATVGNDIDVAGSDVLAVKINNGTITPSTQGNGNVATISIVDGAEITFGDKGKTTFVGAKDLDFSNLTDVKAYIATGYDLATGDIWLTRVEDVPANTPIWVTGPNNTTKLIPAGTSTTYYPENLLVGSATANVNIPAEDSNYAGYTLLADGEIFKQAAGITGFPAGKAYFYLPKTVASSVGSDLNLNLVDYNNSTLVSSVDLDFSNVQGLKAYTVTGFSKNGTIWLTKVNTATAGTPLYLIGTAGSSYTIPSVEKRVYYVNMLEGDATNSTPLTPVSGDFTNYVLIEGKFGRLSQNATFPGGKAYLPLPSAYLPATSRGNDAINFSEIEPEVIKVSLSDINSDGDATGISRIAAEAAAGDDVWYNLSGQRISAPTKKGLYIRNGKKVIVK
jgi:hypothetical protein